MIVEKLLIDYELSTWYNQWLKPLQLADICTSDGRPKSTRGKPSSFKTPTLSAGCGPGLGTAHSTAPVIRGIVSMVLDRSSKIEILDADMCNPKASLFITNGGAAKLGTSKKSRWLENGDITYDPQINGHAGYPVTADWTEVHRGREVCL